MPGIDGFETTRRLRKYEQERHLDPTPVIALSASGMEQDQQNVRTAGMDGFATKPLDVPQLFHEIARVLDLPDVTATRTLVTSTSAGQAQNATIDWERGVRLWVRQSLLCEAISRFLLENISSITDFQHLQAQQDFDGLHALAHRLHGAAANLALIRLQDLAQQVEQAAAIRDEASLASLLPQWPLGLAEVQKALTHGTGITVSPVTGVTAAPLDASSREQVRLAVQTLAQALTRSELDQSSLDCLVQLLPESATEHLQDALDQFDFVQALEALNQLESCWINYNEEIRA